MRVDGVRRHASGRPRKLPDAVAVEVADDARADDLARAHGGPDDRRAVGLARADRAADVVGRKAQQRTERRHRARPRRRRLPCLQRMRPPRRLVLLRGKRALREAQDDARGGAADGAPEAGTLGAGGAQGALGAAAAAQDAYLSQLWSDISEPKRPVPAPARREVRTGAARHRAAAAAAVGVPRDLSARGRTGKSLARPRPDHGPGDDGDRPSRCQTRQSFRGAASLRPKPPAGEGYSY